MIADVYWWYYRVKVANKKTGSQREGAQSSGRQWAGFKFRTTLSNQSTRKRPLLYLFDRYIVNVVEWDDAAAPIVWL